MSSLINRIQRAILGSAGPEKVRALLAELQIPAGGSGGSMREVRRGVLRPISDEAILRDALADMGAGSPTGATPSQGLSDFRNAILHNLVDSETTFRDGLAALMADDDGGGGGEAPAWVPADAKIHIDLVGGTPQGRAWTEAGGEVAVDTLLGSDPNTENGWELTEYNPENLSGDGYVGMFAFIGSARTKLFAGATVRIASKFYVGGLTVYHYVYLSADGNDGTEIDLNLSGTGDVLGSSWNGVFSDALISDIVNDTVGDINVIAATVTSGRLEIAANGSAPATTSGSILANESNPLVAVMIDCGLATTAIQSITLYDPLPDTDGLSELSEP